MEQRGHNRCSRCAVNCHVVETAAVDVAADSVAATDAESAVEADAAFAADAVAVVPEMPQSRLMALKLEEAARMQDSEIAWQTDSEIARQTDSAAEAHAKHLPIGGRTTPRRHWIQLQMVLEPPSRAVSENCHTARHAEWQAAALTAPSSQAAPRTHDALSQREAVR